MQKFCFVILFSLFAFSGAAQERQKRSSPFSIRGVIGIPRALSSAQYRTAFAGLYEGNLSVNARMFSNFYVGLGYQNTHFKNSGFLKYTYFNAQIPYNTRLMGHCGFLKLGYDKFFDKGYVSYSLNTGVMAASYLNVNKDTSAANLPIQGTKFTAPYVQPEIAINFLADRSLSFSIILSYTTMFYKFDARAPRFAHFGEVQQKSNSYYMSWLNIGFGFNVMLGDD